MVLDEKSEIPKVIRIYSEGNMNVWAKFRSNRSNSCSDISLKTTNVNLMVTRKKKSGDH